MYELVLISCLSAASCSTHVYGELFASKTACFAVSQPLAAAWAAEHPNQIVMGIVCRPRQAPGVDL